MFRDPRTVTPQEAPALCQQCEHLAKYVIEARTYFGCGLYVEMKPNCVLFKAKERNRT